jgi:hypothetical protein
MTRFLSMRFAAILAVAVTVGAAALGAAATAHAGNPAADSCTWPKPTAVFQPWNDYNLYFPMEGGSFENGAPGWKLDNGASIGSPNEPAKVGSAADALSLSVPNNASVTSASMCVTSKSPALRLFATNTGGSDRVMQVFVNYAGTDGNAHSTKLVDLKAGSAWSSVQKISFVNAIKPVLDAKGVASVTFTFKVPYQKDRPANFRIDDVYVEDITGICDWPTMSTPFTSWGDTNPYFVVDGGTFENGVAGWTLSTNASTGTPNEPWKVNGSADAYSLGIPNGGSVTTPAVCVTADSPSLRLFSVNTGNPGRVMQIFVNYTGTDGNPHSAKLIDAKNSGSWGLTSSIDFLSKIKDVLTKSGQTQVTFTFSVPYQADNPGIWRIDDVEVDPIKHV